MLAEQTRPVTKASRPGRFGRAAPHCVTAVRATLGMCLMFLAAQRRFETAAVIWLFGLGTDALDGVLARRAGVPGEFGNLFDYFADYVYHVLSPGMMSLYLLDGNAGLLPLLLLSLPAPFAAMRYARKAGLSDTAYPGIPASAGLPTVVYGFYIAALVFLRRELVVDGPALDWALLAGVPLLSILMVSRIRYPKLGVYPWVLIPILTGLVIMPFFETAILARVMMAIVVSYIVISPTFVKQHPERTCGK